jgi:uncharacterized protein (TIGR03067 family)
METTMRAVTATLFALALGLAAPLHGGDKETAAGVLKKIQGTWIFKEMKMDGKALPEKDVTMQMITFAGDRWTVTDAAGKVLQAGTHKLDPSKKPSQVDAAITSGEGKGSTMIGIYELKEDTLRVCFDLKGKDRPTTLEGNKEGQMSAQVEREKIKK